MDSSSFLEAKEKGFLPLANSHEHEEDYEEDIWANYLEEREWMADFSYKREGEDCPRGSRGASVLDFETPSYHIVTLAKEGLAQVVEGMTDLNETQQAAIRNSVAINGVDGSIDDECAPLTMTIKARIYALGSPRSVEVRHEYHKRQGWEMPEYAQGVAWRLNQPAECGRRFMPIYKRDEEGWRTMFYSYLDICRAPGAGTSHASRGIRGKKRGGKGAQRGRGSTRGPSMTASSLDASMLGDSEEPATEDAGAPSQHDEGSHAHAHAGCSRMGVEVHANAARAGAEAAAAGTGSGRGEEGSVQGGGSAHTRGDGAGSVHANGGLGGGGSGSHNGGGGSNSSSPQGPEERGQKTQQATSGTGAQEEDGVLAQNGAQPQQPQQPPTIIRQKWLMNSEDLAALQEHFTAGSELEGEISDGDLLDILLASVGIVNGKVGEVEVGKPMYGRSFLGHYKKRLCGVGATKPSANTSQAVSEVSDDDHHTHSAAAREREQEQRLAATAAVAKMTASESVKRELPSGPIGGLSSRRRKRQRGSSYSAPPSTMPVTTQQQQPPQPQLQQQNKVQQQQPQSQPLLQVKAEPGHKPQELRPPLAPKPPLHSSTSAHTKQQQQQPSQQLQQPQQQQQQAQPAPQLPQQQQQQLLLSNGFLPLQHLQHLYAQHPQLLHPQALHALQAQQQQQQLLQYLAHQQVLHASALHQAQQQQQQQPQPQTPLQRSVFTQGPVPLIQAQPPPTSIFSQPQQSSPTQHTHTQPHSQEPQNQHHLGSRPAGTHQQQSQETHPLPPHAGMGSIANAATIAGSGLPISRGPAAGRNSAPPTLPTSAPITSWALEPAAGVSGGPSGPAMIGPTSLPPSAPQQPQAQQTDGVAARAAGAAGAGGRADNGLTAHAGPALRNNVDAAAPRQRSTPPAQPAMVVGTPAMPPAKGTPTFPVM